jgi:hypothetical protein
MTDDFTFDWVALAPIEEVAAQAEAVCVARGLSGQWYASSPGGIPVKGCRIIAEDGGSLAVLTLQGYQSDQTHLRLQPAAHTSAPDQVGALADALYAALRTAGWMASDSPLLEHTPRFVRPHGFKPAPREPRTGEP